MKKVLNIIAFIALFTGFLILAKPYGRYFLREYESRRDIERFETAAEGLISSDSDTADQLRRSVEQYNEEIFQSGQQDIFADKPAQPQWIKIVTETLPSDMIGWLEIDKINVKMPIFYGIDDLNLSRGACVMEGTSFPAGGENTNCVLAAHRLPGMLGEVEQLETGDVIVLRTFEETLYYRIVKSIVITPYDKEKVMIVPKRDMVTLLTCHPYWVNSHRILVYAERIFEEGSEDDLTPQAAQGEKPTRSESAASGSVVESAHDAESGAEEEQSEQIRQTEPESELLTAEELPDGEPFESSEPTIKTENALRIAGIALTLFFLIRILIILTGSSKHEPRRS